MKAVSLEYVLKLPSLLRGFCHLVLQLLFRAVWLLWSGGLRFSLGKCLSLLDSTQAVSEPVECQGVSQGQTSSMKDADDSRPCVVDFLLCSQASNLPKGEIQRLLSGLNDRILGLPSDRKSVV